MRVCVHMSDCVYVYLGLRNHWKEMVHWRKQKLTTTNCGSWPMVVAKLNPFDSMGIRFHLVRGRRQKKVLWALDFLRFQSRFKTTLYFWFIRNVTNNFSAVKVSFFNAVEWTLLFLLPFCVLEIKSCRSHDMQAYIRSSETFKEGKLKMSKSFCNKDDNPILAFLGGDPGCLGRKKTSFEKEDLRNF